MTPAPSPTPSTTARAAWDAVHQKIAQEMDAAFARNIVKNKAIQDQRRAEREAARRKA